MVTPEKESTTIKKKKNHPSLSIEGQIHNDGLNFVLQELINDSQYGIILFDKANIVTERAVIKYIHSNNIEINPYEEIDLYKNTGVFWKKDILKATELSEKIANFSISDINILIEISTLFRKDYRGFNTINFKFEELKKKINKNGENKESLIKALELGKASYYYWETNFNSWIKALNIKEDLTGERAWCDSHDQEWFWNSVNNMAESDFWGFAVGTAITFNGAAGIGAGLYSSETAGVAALFDCPPIL